MAIQGIEQPESIQVDDNLRLRKYDGIHDFALVWYQDEETVWLVDGNRNPYTMERLGGMYRYLNNAGELYFLGNFASNMVDRDWRARRWNRKSKGERLSS